MYSKSQELTLQLKDTAMSTSTTPWVLQRFQSTIMIPVRAPCVGAGAACHHLLTKHITCARLGDSKSKERCCTQKILAASTDAGAVSNLGDLDIKLGESIKSKSADQSQVSTETNFTFPTSLSTIVPKMLATDVNVAGQVVCGDKVTHTSLGIQKDGVGSEARLAMYYWGNGATM